MTRKHNHSKELAAIRKEVEYLQARVAKLQKEGINVEQVTAALTQLGTDVDALIASKGVAGITPAQAQTIVDGISAISVKVKAATTPAA
jgi:outer membrane murein-binding lipoprotein Lpp